MKRCGFPSPMSVDCTPGCGFYNEQKDMCGFAMLPEIKDLLAAFIEATGMLSENMQRQHQGYSMAYNDEAFYKLLPKERSS